MVFPKAVIEGASTIIPAIALRAVSDKTPSSANGSFSEADSAFNAKTTAGVRLRKGPGLSYDTITVLAEGTIVNVTSTKNSE